MLLHRIAFRSPLLLYVCLAYGWSWTWWAIAIVRPDTPVGAVAFVAGGFGPFLAAALTLRLTREPLGPWIRSFLRWRTGPAFWAFVLLWPPIYVICGAGAFAALGGHLDWSVPASGLALVAPAFLQMALIGGGNEEPGWRGYAQPRLQTAFGAIRGTFFLGLIWACWHLPLLATNPQVTSGGIEPVQIGRLAILLLCSVTLHAFWYAWIWNRTGSVLLCILLHAGYNTSIGLLLPVSQADQSGVSGESLLFALTSVLAISVVILIAATRGRLGRREEAAPPA